MNCLLVTADNTLNFENECTSCQFDLEVQDKRNWIPKGTPRNPNPAAGEVAADALPADMAVPMPAPAPVPQIVVGQLHRWILVADQ